MDSGKHQIVPFRCPDRACNTRLFDEALGLGSVVEVKCRCNAKYVVVATILGLLVAKVEHVTYNRVPEANQGSTHSQSR